MAHGSVTLGKSQTNTEIPNDLRAEIMITVTDTECLQRLLTMFPDYQPTLQSIYIAQVATKRYHAC
jgi:hypothetical protein